MPCVMAVGPYPQFLAPRGNTKLILSGIRQQLFHHRSAGRQNVANFEGMCDRYQSVRENKTIALFSLLRAKERYLRGISGAQL